MALKNMKRRIVFLLIFLFSNQVFAASDLRSFLKYCGYGTVGGALAGVVSLAFVDKPSDHYNNIARGASLGLYAGMGLGIYYMNQEEQMTSATTKFMLVPQYNREKNSIQNTQFLLVQQF